MTQSILDLEPRILWEHFDKILKLPRPSGQEDKMRQWLQRWAKEQGFSSATDKAGNVAVAVPATAGHERAPIIVLQAHMDMVCEKNRDKAFDFNKDPIEVVIDGDWLRTNGTSMGADDGIGVAAALSVAIESEAVHGPLELLFTVDEERGLGGAFNLDPALLKGRILINLDSEEEGTFYVGCAGGGNGHISFPLAFGKSVAGGKGVTVKLTGMKGGHSGLMIHENRANAIKLAARVLRTAREKGIAYSLVRMDGGDKHNAIPRECIIEAVVGGKQVDEFNRLLETLKETFLTEFSKTDPDLAIEVTWMKKAPTKGLTTACRNKLIALLMGLPHGVIAMSRDIAGLVETSNNVASIHFRGKEAQIITSSRSSVASALRNVRDTILEISGVCGAKVKEGTAYPGWQPNMESNLLARAKRVYSAKFGKEPHVTAVHAGLECGILGEKYPGMEMLSFGPTLAGVHSPDEKVHIGSVKNFYTFLKAILRDYAVETCA